MKATKKYSHIFIDLDKTIWDFESNTQVTFSEIFDKYDLPSRGIKDRQAFFTAYLRINEMLWGLYRENKIKKEILNIRRFEMALQEFGVDDLILATHFAEDFIRISPLKTKLFPHSHEALAYLQKKYKLHLITNGFEDVQQKKLDNCDLRKYFRTITTSEEAGVKKPDSGIFELALAKAGAYPAASLMIGDDLEVDIAGARAIGMDTLYFNPDGNNHNEHPDHEALSWQEIMKIL